MAFVQYSHSSTTATNDNSTSSEAFSGASNPAASYEIQATATHLQVKEAQLPILNVQMSPASVDRRQILAAYVNAHIPFDFLQPEDLPWLPLLFNFQNWPLCLEYAVSAVCMAGLGRKAADPSLVFLSKKHYTNGLQGLRIALMKQSSAVKDEVLAACMLLASYEIVECPEASREAYICHHEGCGRLIQFRGPEAHSSGIGLEMFRAYRIQGVSAGMIPSFSIVCFGPLIVYYYSFSPLSSRLTIPSSLIPTGSVFHGKSPRSSGLIELLICLAPLP